jgi:hypothetical protein
MWKVITNVIGASAYLLISSKYWADPRLIDVPGAGVGEPFLWGLTALPILLAFFLLNASYILLACFTFLRTKKWTLGVSFLIVPVIWAIVVYVDFSHHWRL